MRLWPWKKKDPSPPAKRLNAPARRSYQGAMIGRLVADWVSMTSSMDSEINSSLIKLRNRCRQLERDNNHVKSYLREVEENVIGQGIYFQSQVKMQRGDKMNDRVNAEIEKKWLEWTKKDSCHVAGKLSFSQIERLILRSVARDGDVLIRKITQPFGKSKIPFALEVIEADLLDETYNDVSVEGNSIRMGVEVDNWGKPLGYHMRIQHPGDYPFFEVDAYAKKRVRIPASEIIHPFITDRPGQTRGVPWLSSTILKLHYLNGYIEATCVRARGEAALMGFIESPEGEIQAADDVENDQRITEFEPGMFKYLAPGEKVNIPQVNSPSGEFAPFCDQLLRDFSAGAGCSFESISKNYSQSNYSSSRLALMSDRDHWRVLQDWITSHFHQPIFEAWLDMSYLSGQLELPGYEANPSNYQNVRWMPRGWAFVDPQKEAVAAKELILGGLSSISKTVLGQGDDPEELFNEIKRERDLAKSLGLKFDTDVENTRLAQIITPGELDSEGKDVKT